MPRQAHPPFRAGQRVKPSSVLIVSPIASHPATQGNSARIMAVGAELMRRGIVADFLYYGMEGLTAEQSTGMRGFWNRFTFMKSLPLMRPSLPDAWGLDDWCPEDLCQQVEAACQRQRYDAVLVNYVWMSKVLERVQGPLKIIDTHDLFGDRHKVAQSAGLEPRWYFTTAEEERRGFQRADIVLGIQDNETETIAKRFDGLAFTVGHPAEPRFLVDVPRAKPFFNFGYLGSGNPFNVASIKALDGALSGRANVQWALAGSISNRKLTLKSQPTRLGTVDRLADFYDNVECVLNPMIGGTGLKIKTIEALAYGARIIGTKDAFEGLAPTHALHMLDTVEDIALAMQDYLDSAALREELARETFELFARYLARVTEQFDSLAHIIRSGSAILPRPVAA